MKIALFGNPYQEKYKASLNDFVSYLQEASDLFGEDVVGTLDPAGIARARTTYGGTGNDAVAAQLFGGAELAVSIGGDGTLLSKAALLARQGIPVVGINTGHLGYLAACRLNEAREMIESIKHGDCRHEERTMLQLVSINGEPCDNIIALNEIAILRQDTTSMISMPTTINGTMLTTYMGDGLVISTPTGSTAYNMSVGGPIMMPLTSCLALSPISPHSLTMRPIVVSDNSEIVVTINTRAQWIQVSVDGMAMTLPSGSTVKIAQAPYKLSVIQKKEHNFANTLREKLLWGADQR